MSAIAGIFFLDDRTVDRLVLERMVKRIAHRGPDGAGVWSEGPVGLGHRMLYTTPESFMERFPLLNGDGDLALTADARIDNRDELIAALGINGRPREEITDGELILGAYERWGESCPEKLLGDFAFAIWDRRKQRLFCARDHMGLKPFYYHRSGRALVFASEIKALLCVPEVPHRLNEVRVADYLASFWEDKEITFYRGILRLPPAHRMSVDRHGTRIESYWSLDPSREVRLGSDEEYAEAFREIFTEAVGSRLRSAFPAGSMLSGGLDSSAIVCVARQLLTPNGGYRLHTFSAIFDDMPERDERRFIDAVLAGGGLEPHYLHADRSEPLADLDRILQYEDEIFFAPILFLHWGLHNAAQQHGVRVLLNGLDGDSVVSHGYDHLTKLARRGRWRTLVAEVNGLHARLGLPRLKTLLQFGIKPLAPEPLRQARRILRRRKRLPQATASMMINADFAQRIDLAGRVQTAQEDRSGLVRTAREHHLRVLTSGLFTFMLEANDRAAAVSSIEPRSPFYDKRLVEFCLALPPEQKLQQGWTRVVVRRALADILPAEVRWRGGKGSFAPNFIPSLLTLESALMEEVILDDPQAIEEYMDVPALREAYHRYTSRSTRGDAVAVPDVVTVLQATTLALWLRQTGLVP